MKIVTILGARPQFIKAGSISREILRRKQTGINIEEVIVHTGQHYDSNMSDIFFDEMKIPKPDYFLGIGSKSHSAMTGQMMEKIETLLLKEKPDWVMVYGDTNSTLAGAITASKLHIRIAHVEAGLRSFNMDMPEEINRILTDRISSLLFCPTQTAVDNLKNEGVDQWKTGAKVVMSGDVMQDGALFYQKLAQKPLGITIKNDFILCTIHRAENTDDNKRLSDIISSLNKIAKTRQIILPLHPRTKKLISLNNFDTSNLTIIDPVGYLNMVWLINACKLIITDSGGLQKEAYFFAKPCITLRKETEWVELVDVGVNQLVEPTECNIVTAINSYKDFASSSFSNKIYGKGDASINIIKKLLSE